MPSGAAIASRRSTCSSIGRSRWCARDLTFEVPERINAKGEVLIPLDWGRIEELAVTLRKRRVEAVAVCLLHSYANPSHERRIGEILRQAMPELFVTLSHEILREYREYERTSTTALNAYVGPRVQTYLRRLETYLRAERFGGKIQIMRSNGGVMSIGLAQEQPVSMMESGPVAGMIGAGRLALDLKLERCIGFDMGGTTAKTSLITNGAPAIEEGYVIGGRRERSADAASGRRHCRGGGRRRVHRLGRCEWRHPCRPAKRGRRSRARPATARAISTRW